MCKPAHGWPNLSVRIYATRDECCQPKGWTSILVSDVIDICHLVFISLMGSEWYMSGPLPPPRILLFYLLSSSFIKVNRTICPPQVNIVTE